MTSEVLDLAVAQAAFRARQVERALHDPGPWEMSWGPSTVPVCRMIFPTRVTFLAHFPSQCHLVEPDPIISLLCNSEIVGTREIDFPGDGEFEVSWEWAVVTPVLA